MTLETKLHCVKSARVRSFCGSYFPAFGMNTDQKNSEYGHFSRSDHFFKGTAKIKRWSFQGRNFISLETVGGMFTLVIIEAWRHVFVSYRETLNLLLKKSITTTDEPPTLLTLLTFIIIVIKVAQSILIMTTEMLIAILLQKRIE